MSLFGRKRKDDDERKKLELELAEAAQEKLRGTEATGADPEATQPGIAVPETDDSEAIAKTEGEALDTTPSEEVDHEHDMREVSGMSHISTTAKEWHDFYRERLEEKLGQRREMESKREKLRADLREMEELLAVLNKDVDEALGERYERVVIEPINQKKDELNRRMAESLEEESQQLEADIRCLSTALERLEGYVRE